MSRHGVGYDAVDAPALTARGIPLAVVGDVNSRAVAEHAFALMLALAKRVTAHDAATRERELGAAQQLLGPRARRPTLLLVGYGRIGGWSATWPAPSACG